MGPLRQYRPQRVLLGLVNDLAALPSDGFDQLSDFPFDAIAQIVGVHRVQLPWIDVVLDNVGLQLKPSGIFTLGTDWSF